MACSPDCYRLQDEEATEEEANEEAEDDRMHFLPAPHKKDKYSKKEEEQEGL